MPTPIIERIRSADNLPSLPSVAFQVLQLTRSEDASLADIARVIQQDPAITFKILKVVNSSLFGVARKVSSLQQAVVVLGLRTVKVMVLSFSLIDTFKDRNSGSFDYTRYWRRSLTAAVTAKTLAERSCRKIAEEAFVGGLLCDLGILAAYHCTSDLYLPVLLAHGAGGGLVQDIERQILGVTHESITSSLLDHWGLPECLCRAIATHHAPLAANLPSDQTEAALTRTLRAAAAVADLFCAEHQAGLLDACKARIAADLPISDALLNDALETLDAHVKETASLFALKIGPTRSYQDLQADAVMQLARLSMAAELERAQTAQREQAALQEVEQLNTRNRELAHRIITDGLTGVGNRAALEDRLVTECRNAREGGTPLGLLMMDLDRFKRLNDTFGHQTGDEALQLVGDCLNRFASQRHFPARYGGEEFAVVVSGCSARELYAYAENLRNSIRAISIPFGQKRISITVSVGAAHLDADDPDLNPKAIVRLADECLYEAKHAGRNCVVCTSTKQRPARQAVCT